jgi:hypothetical protein
MLAAESYESLIAQLSAAFVDRYKGRPRLFATGVLLFQPQSEFAKKEIIPYLHYLDTNSADYIDFFSVGFKAIPSSGAQPTGAVGPTEDSWWTFYPEQFVKFKRALEADFSCDRKSWHYSGGTDLLLFNAIFDEKTQQAELGFETVMAIDLELEKKDNAIDNVVKLLELIVRLAESQDSSNPIFKISDQLAMNLGKRQLWDIFYDVLPFKFGDKARKFEHFAVG